MKTTNLGMPNVYGLQIKKAVEGYWKGANTIQDITAAKNAVIEYNQKVQSNLDLIPVGEIDVYDRLLRTAVCFGIVPKRFGTPEEANSNLGVYLSIPRGTKDAHASPMVKWFNTNYHIVQPEIEKDPRIVDFSTLLGGCGDDKKLALIGPWTLLSYSINKTEDTKEELFSKLADLYVELINNAPSGTVIQLEEPSFLINEIPENYRDFVAKLEKEVHLHVYFGAVNEFAGVLFDLPVEGIGLDFVDGTKNIELLERFPSDKILIAGIVNGRNVWPVSTKSKNVLETILKHVDEERLFISPSCSLLHVPLSAENEEHKFSFALEKLAELQAIKEGTVGYVEVLEEEKPLPETRFERSRKTFWVSETPYTTTTIGSFPQSPEIRNVRASWKRKEIDDEQYKEKIREFIAGFIKKQEELKIDVLVHGEPERADMVQYFAENFDGFDQIKGPVQSYGTRIVRPPVVTGDISRPKAFTVEWIKYAQSLTDKPVKGMLTGPITLSRWSFPREDISREAQMYQFAQALADEVNDLVANGIKHIQIDEPAIREGLPIDSSEWDHYLKHAVNAFRAVYADVPEDIVIYSHLCFSEFSDILHAINDMRVDVLSIEDSKAHGKVAAAIREGGFEGSIGLGVFDVHSPRIPDVDEMLEIPKLLIDFDPKRIWINPDCGLKTRGEEAWTQLENMVKVAQRLRESA